MFRNFEGYPDPTAGRAFANIAKEERKAKATRGRAVMAETVGATKKRRHPIRRKKNNCRPKIGVMRW
jgi:hypothetical protein